MPIVQAGSINTTALAVPDTYVQIQQPRALPLNGVPSNILGIVGIASWGPVGAPTIVGGYNQGSQVFGPMNARTYDLMTAVRAAEMQGANVFALVRVTDGTDVAATILIQTNCLTVTSKYTGTLGNKITVTIGAGSAASSYAVTVAMPGVAAERFDNITGSGNALWVNIAAAINQGINGLVGPSSLVVATAGAGSTAPTNTTYTLSGGTDGATTITASTLVGVDTTPRTGMYALRGTGAAVGMLADVSDSTTWTTQNTFGLSEQMYMVTVGPVGQAISAAVTAKASAGVDSYALKILHGDWCYFADEANGVTRLISPQAFIAGLLAALSPEQSTLNKPLNGIVATQTSFARKVYSMAELQQLSGAQIDVITNPVPGGRYFGARFGRNSSSDPRLNGDNYTRMTNYIATTLNAGMGRYVGQLQSPATRREAKSTLETFLSNLEQQGMIGTANGSPSFSVQINDANNPPSRVSLGYMQADIKVVYLSVIAYLLLNVEAGQTVQISQQSVSSFAR